MFTAKTVKTSPFLFAYAVIAFVIAITAMAYIIFMDDDKSDSNAACMSPEDECEVFQPVQDNPYDPTPSGTEAVNGQVPPALEIFEAYNTYAMKFTFGDQSEDTTGHEFILPLESSDIDVINVEYPDMAPVLLKVAQLDGVTQLMVTHGSLAVNYSDDANNDLLKQQIMVLIANFG